MVTVKHFDIRGEKDPSGVSFERGCLARFSAIVRAEEGEEVTLPGLMLFKGSAGYFVKPPRRPGKTGFVPAYYLNTALRRTLCTAAMPHLKAEAK